MYLGIDFGTSGCRAVIIDADGGICAEAQVELPQPVVSAGKVEQQADAWLLGLYDLLQQLAGQISLKSIRRLALDATSGTVLLTDSSGQPLTPARMYNDQSGAPQVERMRQVCPVQEHLAISASSTLARVLALQQDFSPSLDFRIAHQADFLTARLGADSGSSDYHNALKLGLDPATPQWPDWLAGLLPATALPRIQVPGSVVGRIADDLVQRFGFDPALEICAATTDANAAFIATAATRAGQAVTSLGSTLVLKLLSPTRIDLPQRGVYSHRLDDLWLVGGASNAGAAVLRDYFSAADIAHLSAQMAVATPTGLDYYPLQTPGERFPDPDPARNPCLQPRPQSDVLFLQGILESLTRIETDGYRLLEQAGAPALVSVSTMGGGAQNPQWTAMRQTSLQVPVRAALHTEAAYGAALLAMHGLQPYCHRPV